MSVEDGDDYGKVERRSGHTKPRRIVLAANALPNTSKPGEGPSDLFAVLLNCQFPAPARLCQFCRSGL